MDANTQAVGSPQCTHDAPFNQKGGTRVNVVPGALQALDGDGSAATWRLPHRAVHDTKRPTPELFVQHQLIPAHQKPPIVQTRGSGGGKGKRRRRQRSDVNSGKRDNQTQTNNQPKPNQTTSPWDLREFRLRIQTMQQNVPPLQIACEHVLPTLELLQLR